MAVGNPIILAALTGLTQSTLGHYLELGNNSQELLEVTAGHTVAIRFLPYDIEIFLCPTKTNVQVLSYLSTPPDTIISGSLSAFTRLGLGGIAAESLQPGDIVIQGNVDVARKVQNIFSKLDVNWEEQLAKHIGSKASKSALNMLRNSSNWISESLIAFRTDLVEYLREESRTVPTDAETFRLYSDIDNARSDIERLSQRIERLYGLHTSTSSRTR
jgi:ubiquinone biosynthesis protein UbiJ